MSSSFCFFPFSPSMAAVSGCKGWDRCHWRKTLLTRNVGRSRNSTNAEAGTGFILGGSGDVIMSLGRAGIGPGTLRFRMIPMSFVVIILLHMPWQREAVTLWFDDVWCMIKSCMILWHGSNYAKHSLWTANEGKNKHIFKQLTASTCKYQRLLKLPKSKSKLSCCHQHFHQRPTWPPPDDRSEDGAFEPAWWLWWFGSCEDYHGHQSLGFSSGSGPRWLPDYPPLDFFSELMRQMMMGKKGKCISNMASFGVAMLNFRGLTLCLYLFFTCGGSMGGRGN